MADHGFNPTIFNMHSGPTEVPIKLPLGPRPMYVLYSYMDPMGHWIQEYAVHDTKGSGFKVSGLGCDVEGLGLIGFRGVGFRGLALDSLCFQGL